MSHICTVGDGDWDLLTLPTTINIHGHALHNIELFYGDCVQPRRRLLEHSHRIKQAYRSNYDYDVAPRRYRSKNKFDDNRVSLVKNDEDENEDEEEEEEDEGDEENKINDETIDDEIDEQDEDEEETVNEEPSEIYDYG